MDMNESDDKQVVSLRKLSRRNIKAVLALKVTQEQEKVYPRSNGDSIAEGHYPADDDPVWMRAIYAGEEAVGFLMTSEAPAAGEYFLWRLMIDATHQGKGYGFRAVTLLVERIQQSGDGKVLLTSHLTGDGDAGKFYQKLGFEYTGELLGGVEPMMKMAFEEHVEPIPDIETPRLRLVSMSAQLLRLLIEGKFEEARNVAGFGLPDGCLPPESEFWVTRTLRMTEGDPEQRSWMMHRAIVHKENNKMIGHIRFHHKPPDPDLQNLSKCAVELGYAIDPSCRRKGYGKESAVAMMEWAHSERGVSTFFLSISPSNLPSLKLAASMGFRKVGEKMDDIDGLEYIMKAEIHEIRGEANARGNTWGIKQ